VKVGDFARPVFVTAPAGDTQRTFVVERGGAIRLVIDGVTQPTPFLDISGLVATSDDPDDERGLLSMAFAPDYGTSGRFYVYYTGRTPAAAQLGNILIDEFRSAGGSVSTADPATRRNVLEIPHSQAPNHNGGQLAFGPDGYLWLGTGDGGGSNDPSGNGQNVETRLGKMLRIDPRAGASLVPADNPFVGAPGDDLIWSYGLRNPYRFSFDRATGDLAIADVGQGFVEEIDFTTKAGGLGRAGNYGWSVLEGRYLLSNQMLATPAQTPPGHIPPVIEKLHSAGWCAIVGGYVVRDPALPELLGKYIYGDFCKGDIYAATLSGSGAANDAPTGLNVASTSAFGEDGCGRVYVTSIAGPVYRLASSGACAGPAPVPFPIPPGTPGSDAVAPHVTMQRASRQRVLRRGAVVVRVQCDEDCSVRVTGRVQFRQGSRLVRLSLRPATGRLTAGAARTLRLRVPSAVRPALRRTLTLGRRAVVTITVRAQDAAGNVRFVRSGIRVIG
jgi:glucose/arabinose dehydrogenase